METKNSFSFPRPVTQCLKMLSNSNAKPYIVGGAGRDILLGKTPNDYDIASDFTPIEVLRVCNQNHIPVVDNLGNNFGVVVAVFEDTPIEIATFRSEEYSAEDAHRPSSVYFTKSLKKDLARRDFTINAMAMDINGKIFDPFHGQEDLENKIITPVGKAKDRYQEDPLRMFRACRFVSQLGFNYYENNQKSDYIIKPNYWKETKADKLSMERIRKEMEKTLLSKKPSAGLRLMMNSRLFDCPCVVNKTQIIRPLQPLTHLYKLSQNPKYHKYDAWEHILHSVDFVPADLKLRYAMLFHDVAKGYGDIRGYHDDGTPHDHGHETKSAEIVTNTLTQLGYSKKFIKEVNWLVLQHMQGFMLEEATDKTKKHWLRRKAKECYDQKDLLQRLKDLKEVFCADAYATNENMKRVENIQTMMDSLSDTAQKQMVVHSHDLAINGRIVFEMLKDTDLNIKDVYASLIKKVQDGVIPNKEEFLLKSLNKQIESTKEMTL